MNLIHQSRHMSKSVIYDPDSRRSYLCPHANFVAFGGGADFAKFRSAPRRAWITGTPRPRQRLLPTRRAETGQRTSMETFSLSPFAVYAQWDFPTCVFPAVEIVRL